MQLTTRRLRDIEVQTNNMQISSANKEIRQQEQLKKLIQEKRAQPLIQGFDCQAYKAKHVDQMLSAKRSEAHKGAYDHFADKFDPRKGSGHVRKTQLIENNLRQFGSEQRRIDMMQSFFLSEHQKDMNKLQKFR